MKIPVIRRETFTYYYRPVTYIDWIIPISYIISDDDEYLGNHIDSFIRECFKNKELMNYINSIDEYSDEFEEEFKKKFPEIRQENAPEFIFNNMRNKRFFIIRKLDDKYSKPNFLITGNKIDLNKGKKLELDIDFIKKCYEIYKLEILVSEQRYEINDEIKNLE